MCLKGEDEILFEMNNKFSLFNNHLFSFSSKKVKMSILKMRKKLKLYFNKNNNLFRNVKS